MGINNNPLLSDKLNQRLSKSCLASDFTVAINNTIIYATNVYADGTILGWWSHSPWGNVRDQEVGWMLVSPEGKEIDSCPTRVDGGPAGENFAEWRKSITSNNGKSLSIREIDSPIYWKLSDA